MIELPAIHLCVTHSPLVTRVFQAEMRRRQIPETATAYFSRRNTSFTGPGLLLDELSDTMDLAYRKLDRRAYHAERRRLDEAIRSLCGGTPFNTYIPHLNKMLYQEIVLHPLCCGYSFLEEGYTSMNWSHRRNVRITGSKILRNRLRDLWIGPRYQLARPMFDSTLSHYHSACAISEFAFRGMAGRIDVSAYLPPLPPGTPPGKIFLTLDASYLHQGVLWNDYEDAIMTALRNDVPHVAELLVKFHFADSKADERFPSLANRLAPLGFPSIRKLPDNFPIEENLTTADLLVFGTTSLGYYTGLAGGRVKCFASSIQGMSVEDWIRRGELPEDFREVVGIGS